MSNLFNLGRNALEVISEKVKEIEARWFVAHRDIVKVMTVGIHHITAIASNASENVRFYTKVLGLRLVKKTVNQDDTSAYHLFFGDTEGSPGLDLTFFIFQPIAQGRWGVGRVTKISFAVPKSALAFWQERFREFEVKQHDIDTRFGKERIVFFDPDGQRLELVGMSEGELDSKNEPWTAEVAKEQAIQSFYSATLSVTSREAVVPILTHVFGYKEVGSEPHTSLFEAPGSNRAQYIEVNEEPFDQAGYNAAGTVHHIAFRAKDEEELLTLRQRVAEIGLFPTEVIDRFYFKSVYFRTPGGILFEIATDGPGFTADEDLDKLGEGLALPPFLEPARAQIEAGLPEIKI